MTTPTIILIIAVVLVLLIVFWLIRSRGNTAGTHIDTTLTAVGAVTEAAEEFVDVVEHAIKTEKPAASAKAATVAKAEPVVIAKPAAKAKAAAKPKTAASAKPAAKAKTAANPKPVASPKLAAASLLAIGIPAASGAPDNLRQLKGVGPKLGVLLTELGIMRFDQIAAWSAADIDKVDDHLGTFKGRIVRDSWIEQAAFLAKNDIAGFEAKFGKLDSPGNN